MLSNLELFVVKKRRESERERVRRKKHTTRKGFSYSTCSYQRGLLIVSNVQLLDEVNVISCSIARS